MTREESGGERKRRWRGNRRKGNIGERKEIEVEGKGNKETGREGK